MSIIRIEKTANYSVIANACLQNPNISARAKGIYAWVMTLPPDWEVHRKHVYKNFTEGRDAIDTAWNELIAEGYVVKTDVTPRNEKGEWKQSCWIFYEVSRIEVDAVSLKTRALKNGKLINRSLKTRKLLNTNTILNTIYTKENIYPTFLKKDAKTGFLSKWNELAEKYGFRTHRTNVVPDFEKRIARIAKTIHDQDSKQVEAGWEMFLENIEDTMKRYRGSTFVRYFTMEYVTREKKFPALLDSCIENFPWEEDPDAKRRMMKSVEKQVADLEVRKKRAIELLENARKTKNGKLAKKFRLRAERIGNKITLLLAGVSEKEED